jgi:hypothetical protein
MGKYSPSGRQAFSPAGREIFPFGRPLSLSSVDGEILYFPICGPLAFVSPVDGDIFPYRLPPSFFPCRWGDISLLPFKIYFPEVVNNN